MSDITRPLYLDCDTGVDDSMALAYLLASPEVTLVGIGGVHGNVSAEQGVRNALGLLTLAGRHDIPVAVGEASPLCGTFDGGAPHVHGTNGVGGVDLPEPEAQSIDEDAADLLLELSHRYAGELEIVAVGPLSNLGRALERDSELPERIRRVTLMGGAALVPGNISPVAEANIGNDPEAASIVIAAEWEITMVPLDTTLENTLEEPDRQRLLEAPSPVVRAVGQMLDFYFKFYVAEYGRRCSALHDPLAAAIAVGEIVPAVAPRVPVTVDTTSGPGRGQTICDLRGQRQGAKDIEGAHVRVVLDSGEPLAPRLAARLLSL